MASDLTPETVVERLCETIPHLDHEQLVNLSLYLALEMKLNDKQLWSFLQDACLKVIHLFNTKQICQLEWATT